MTIKMRALFLVVAIAGFSSLSDAAERLWKKDPNVLACSPSTLGTGQSIKLKLGKNHGSELGVRREADKFWYFLVVHTAPREMNSLMTPEAFAGPNEILLNSDTLGFEWVDNGRNTRVFSQSGSYTILVIDSLESEQGDYVCTISYEG